MIKKKKKISKSKINLKYYFHEIKNLTHKKHLYQTKSTIFVLIYITFNSNHCTFIFIFYYLKKIWVNVITKSYHISSWNNSEICFPEN